MSIAPQHDWRLYDSMASESEAAWLRGLTPADRYTIYADLFQLVWESRQREGDWERLDRWNWQTKLAMRQRMLTAYRGRDGAQH